MRDQQQEFGDTEIAVVTFSPVERLDAYRRHLGLDFAVLSDIERVYYRRLGLGQGRWRDVYNPGTLKLYGRLLGRGRRLRRSGEDFRQLGGDVVVDRNGRLAAVFRPRSPDERPTLAQLAEAVDSVG